MKRIVFFILIINVFIYTSCNNDFLDLQPTTQYADDAVWNKDLELIQAFVTNMYRGLGQNGIRVMLGTYVDETMLTFGWATEVVTLSNITPSSFSRFNNSADQPYYYLWNSAYSYIRSCNIFFEKIENSKAVNDVQKDRLKGEVYFLRAYFYQMLVSMYGGVPIIDKAYKLGEDYLVVRNSYEDCIKFIVNDLDKSAELLAETTSDKGRATKGAALALKARVLLYAASDLYNCNGSWATGYGHPELIGYVGGNRTARWQAAKDASAAVMNMGYELHEQDPSPSDNVAQNYTNIFLLKETSEDIFVKYTLQSQNTGLVGPNLNNGPNGYYLRGANTPIGQLVDDYEMQDGSKFSWDNPEHKQNPYANREPRFYASILYDGAKWRPRTPDAVPLDPIGVIQTSHVEKWNSTTNKIDLIYGLDTRQGPITNWNGSYTGYYIRKGIDPTYDAQYFNQETPWRFIRYTEILLNYAEACLGLGQEDEAKKYINIIRKRAGLPPINETGQALIERYRHERRIELVFEDHRFFDVRRWMIAPQSYKNVEGVSIIHKLNPDLVTTTPNYTLLPSVQQRDWKDRFYFIPIEFNEMNNNKNLIQNPLYD